MEFELRAIGEVAEFLNGQRKPVTRADRLPGDFPYYGAAGIQDYVSDYLFDGEYVLVGEDGTVLTDCDKPIMQRVSGKFWVNNHAHVLKCETNSDTDFLYYALGQQNIKEFVTGAVQLKLNMGNLKQIQIPWPESAPLRSGIALHLRTIDEKIRVNQQIASTLEQIAQTIFKSWFVDFDPVHAKARGEQPVGMDAETAALFPDSFEDSELGLIPSGWKCLTLGDMVQPKKGKTITRATTREGDVPVVAGGLEPAYFHDTSNVNPPVITISASGANAGFVRLYTQPIWASDCTYISREQTDVVLFWLQFLKLNQARIYDMQQGGAQPHIYASDLIRLQVCVPEEASLLARFEALIQPMFEVIGLNTRENETLGDLRDSLLPRLISGELEIPDEMLGA